MTDLPHPTEEMMNRWIYPMNPQEDSAGDQVGEPPDDLLREWYHKAQKEPPGPLPFCRAIAALAAQWGWDQREPEIQKARDEELDACEKWIKDQGYHPEVARDFRAARRPQPSDKEQGLAALDVIETYALCSNEAIAVSIIRRILEALPNG